MLLLLSFLILFSQLAKANPLAKVANATPPTIALATLIGGAVGLTSCDNDKNTPDESTYANIGDIESINNSDKSECKEHDLIVASSETFTNDMPDEYVCQAGVKTNFKCKDCSYEEEIVMHELICHTPDKETSYKYGLKSGTKSVCIYCGGRIVCLDDDEYGYQRY